MTHLLQVEGLRIRYPEARQPAVADLGFDLGAGEALGIVGESGSGKTQTALAILGLLPARARVQGSVRFDGCELIGKGNKLLNRFRARRIAMVFQDPKLALNPYVRIGDQLKRVLLEHRICRRRDVRGFAIDLLARVELPDPEKQLRAWPHELSGGMRQRAMIALALAGQPDVLVADEPTTALDVTVQAQILQLLCKLREQTGVALMLITHDLGVIAENCERMLVMHGGRLLEQGTTAEVFRNPRQAHTRRMLDAALRIDAPIAVAPLATSGCAPLLEIEGLTVSFRETRAVCSVDLAVLPGETVAIVGESGSGKTSFARAVAGLLSVDEGAIRFLGNPLARDARSRPPDLRRKLQMVFQDPVASLNPAMQVEHIVAEPVVLREPQLTGAKCCERVIAMLRRVGLDETLLQRFPHELSGGQAQRVAIARALVLEPRLLICDEAVAALDGTVRKGILDLLRDEQQRSGLSILFITHDLAVVRQISHRVLVMYRGRVCEFADNESLFAQPRHAYTRSLLEAVPIPDPSRRRRSAA